MTSSANALQAAIYERLAGDATLTGTIGAGSVFDRRMIGKPMPYVVLGEITTTDYGPGAEEHLLAIEAWSDGGGRREAQDIADRVKAVLDDAVLAPAGIALVGLMHRSTRTRREPKTRAQVAEMVFRAVTE